MEGTERKHRRASRRHRNLVQKNIKLKGYRHVSLSKYSRKQNRRIIDAGIENSDN